jgi:hypothetical protein
MDRFDIEQQYLSDLLGDQERAMERYASRRNLMLGGAGVAFALSIFFLAVLPPKDAPLTAIPVSILIPLGLSLIAASYTLFPIKDMRGCETAMSSYRSLLQELDTMRSGGMNEPDVAAFRGRIDKIKGDLSTKC